MAKNGLINVTANNTFQVWLDRTNELVDLMGSDVITASVSGDTTGVLGTPRNATLIGTFSANTFIANTRMRADKIGTIPGSTDITLEAPTIVNTATRVAFQAFSSSVDPVIRINNDSVAWDVGFDDDSQSFVINTGVALERFKLTTAGNLTVSGNITAGTGGFVGGVTGNVTGDVTGNLTGNVTGNVTGNLTGNITGDVTGNLTGNVTGDVTGDVFASNGTTKVLENGNGTTVAATFTGNVTVPSGATLNASNASSISLPAGFGLVPTGGIIMWSGSVASIPTGWALCNGSSGTPDMRDRFVVGAGNSYAVGDTGGANSVTLTEAQMPAHTHTFSGSTNTTGAHIHPITGDIFSGNGTFTGFTPRTTSGNFFTNNNTTSSAGDHSHTFSGTTASRGGGQAHENRPPYYALAYIMKL
jgi:microcystin-dependent protein